MKKDRLGKAIDAIITRLEKAENFVLEQAPDVCKEVIVEKKALLKFYLIMQILGVALSIGGFFLAKTFLDPSHSTGSNDNFGPCLGMGLSLLMSLIFAGLSIETISKIISLVTAPKLTILRELKDLND